MGTALLNFGTRANNIGHGTLDFCSVKANFSARVPRPPQEVVSARLKRGPRAETRGSLGAHDSATKAKALGSTIKLALGRQNLVLFARRKMASKNSKTE